MSENDRKEADTNRADDIQCGGTHYKKCPPEYQHWNLVTVHGWDYFQAQIIKYVMRFREKEGVLDLTKAQHFLGKLIELEGGRRKDEPDERGEGPHEGRGLTRPHPKALRKEKQKFPRSNEDYVYEGGTRDYDLWRCRDCRDHFKTPLEADPREFHSHSVTDTEPSANYVDPDK